MLTSSGELAICLRSVPELAPSPVQVWLQEFAWTEEEKAERLSIRSSSGVCPDTNDGLSKEPMFCFETAMNMLYWSALVYDYEEVRAYIYLSSVLLQLSFSFSESRVHAKL